jgi:PAP2 superfamily
MLTFPRNYWDPDLLANVYLPEFLRSKWDQSTPATPGNPGAEISDLIAMKGQREARLADILDQSASFSQVFPRRLMYSYASHPRTFEVVKLGVLIGRVAVMHWKYLFKRPRPAQISLDVDPVIETPGHPSYPSGHSTQAHLCAGLLAEIHTLRSDPQWRATLFALADEIAKNREIAGVHYPSDTAAGRKLGADIKGILLTDCPEISKLIAEAKREW